MTEPQPGAARTGRATLIAAGLLGSTLVFTRVTAIGPLEANLSLADLVLLPALVVLFPALRGRWPLHYWLFSLLLMQVVSWLNGLEYTTSNTLMDLLKEFVNFAYALVGFAIGRLRGTDRAFAKGALWTVAPVCLIMVVAGVTGQPRWFLEPSMVRVQGPMTDPNGMCVYLAGLLPLVLSIWPGWVLLILAGVLTTASRTGTVAAAVALPAWLLVQRRVVFLLVLAAVLLLLLPLLPSLMPNVSVQRLLAYEDTLSRRINTWDVAWRTVSMHPFLGVGRGNYPVVQAAEQPGPHNTYLDMMVANGVIGVTLFLVPVLYWMTRSALRDSGNLWVVTVLACLVGGLAVSLWDWRLFWLAVGAMNGRHMVREGRN